MDTNISCWPPSKSRNLKPFWSDGYDFTKEHLSLLAMQMVFVSMSSHCLHFLLKPLQQPPLISQLLVGIISGPSILGRNPLVQKLLFPREIHITMDTIAYFTSMLYLFQVGVKADPFVINRSGKKAVAIGFSCYVTSFIFGFLTKNHLHSNTYWMDKLTANQRENDMPRKIVLINIFTSFPVIAIALTDMNIINSDLGRLATSSAMIINLLSYAAYILTLVMRLISENKYYMALGAISSTAGLWVFNLFIARPASLWIIRRTPEGKPVKELYISGIFILVLMCGCTSEIIGQNALVGVFLMGLVIPDGPPLGAALVEKLHCLVTVMFMPLQVAILGMKTDISLFKFWEFEYIWGAELITFACFVGKIVGVGVPALLYKVPLQDAFLLGLIMNIKGIVDLSVLNVWTHAKRDHIDIQTNTIAVVTILFLTGTITPLVKHLYDPSRRYLNYERRSILHVKHSNEFRVVVCIHNQDDVHPLIRILKNSTADTKPSNLNLFILHLVELVGRAAPLFITHHPEKKPCANPTQTERIIKAFRNFQKCSQSQVSIQAFSSICYYSSMHIDIISLAIDKGASFIIIPLPIKHKNIDASIEPTSKISLKTLFQNLLKQAPCTVGILIDLRGSVVTAPMPADPSIYRIVVLFLGGPDDREALAYAMNLVEHSCVNLTVIRIVGATDSKSIKRREMTHDNHVIDHFRHNMMLIGRTLYKEEEVKDGVETSWIVGSMKDKFDLIMVGRRQTTNPDLTSGIDEWNECEELGIIGDMLTSPEFMNEGSLLVVQQQHESKTVLAAY